jgi:uncharacterized coiled-coil protein SlyX
MSELIETKIAFLERANSELSDVVYRQQNEIRALAAKVAELAERLAALVSDPRMPTPEEEKPPHY